jgi:hypothetical protein
MEAGIPVVYTTLEAEGRNSKKVGEGDREEKETGMK